jgi:FixJ family two-component response regulator
MPTAGRLCLGVQPDAVAAGAHSVFMEKPVNVRELVATVKRLTEVKEQAGAVAEAAEGRRP